MPLTVAELQATLGLDIRDLKAGAAVAQREFADLRKSASSAGGGFDDLKKAAQSTETAFKTLGIGSSKAFQEIQRSIKADEIRAAFSTIQKSSFATGAEVDRASKAMQSSLRGLTSDATTSGAGFAKFQGAATAASGALSQAGINTGILGQAIGALTSPVGLAAVAVGVLSLAIKTTTDFMVQNYQQMRSLMAVSGLEAEAADQLADTFDLLGFNVDALRGALFRMATEVDSGGKGLLELGVDIRSASGALKSEGAIFLEVRDRISEMGSSAERNAAIMARFGRAGKELAPVFALNTAEFNKWLEAAGKIGPSAEESMRVTQEYTRASAALNKEWQGMVETVGQSLLPRLTELLKALKDLSSVKPGATGDAWISWLNELGNAIPAPLAALALLTEGARKAKKEMDDLARVDTGLGATPPEKVLTIDKAQVEQLKLSIKEVEAARLRSIDLVQARGQAAMQLEQTTASQAAQQSIGLAQQRFAAKAAAIDGEIAAIRRTSSTEIREGTEAHDKIRALTVQRADAHGQMAASVIGLEASIKAATIAEQREIAASAIDTLKARLSSTAALLGIKQQSTFDIVGVQGSDEAAFRARLDSETQAKIDAAEAQTKTSADYAAAVEAIMKAHYAKLGGFLREALDRDIAAMPEALGELGRSIALVGDATEADITPMEKAWEDLRLEMVDVELASTALGGRFDLTSALIKVQEQRVRLLAAEYGPLSEKVRAAVGELDRLKAKQYGEDLVDIASSARLLGRDYDALTAEISAVTKEMLRLAKEGQNVTALQEKLAGLKQVQELKGIFNDVFGSISSAINTSVQGVILGTTTMAKAWDNLWKSIVLSFVNSGIQRLLKGLQDWALDFVFGGSSGGSSGGGWLNAIFGGISKALSGGSSAASGVDVAATGTEFDAVSTSVAGATKGIDLFAGGLSDTVKVFGGALALAGSIYGLVSSIKSGNTTGALISGAGTALSAYSVAVSVSSILAKAGIITTALPTLGALVGGALAAVAPSFALALATTPVFATLAPTITAGITAGLVNAGVVLGPAAGGAVGGAAIGGGTSAIMASLGAMAPALAVNAAALLVTVVSIMNAQAEEAAETSQILRETKGALRSVSSSMELVANRFDNLKVALDAARLPQTLAELQSALDSLPDLALAVGVGATGITAMIPEWRAKFGAALVAALDAAHAQGIDGGAFVADRNRRLADPMVGGVPAGDQDRTLAVLQDTDLFRRWAQNLRSIDKIITVQQHFLDSLEMDATGMATGSKGGGALPDWLVGGPQNTQLIDVMKMNAQLDREHLTIAIRNAIVDVGAMLGVNASGGLTPAGSEADWQAVGGGLGRTDPLPSVAAIAQVQAALDAAGFVPGEYGKALEAYLISIDQNVVNHPMWAKFSAALKGATTGAGLTDALASIMAGPGAFNTAAGAIIGSLNAQIAAQVTARRQATDPEAAAAIDKVLEGLGAQLKAWNDGFKHLYASSVSVRALLPPDLAAQANKALQPLWLGLVDTMRTGATEQASVAAQLYAEQLGAWGAFGVAIAEAVDVQALVPPDLAARVRAELAPAYDAILATLTEGNVALAMLQLEQFNKEVAAYKAVGQLINTIHVEVAGLTNEVGAIIAAWQMQAAQMDRAVARSKSVFEGTLSSGDVQATADAALAYHTALLARLDAEVKAVREIEAAMQALVDNYMVPLAARATQLAVSFLEMGDPARLTGLLTTLAEIAEVGQTAGVRLSAIGAGLRTIIAALPVAVKGTAEIPGLAGDQIPATVTSAATPFLTQLDDLIADALLGGDTRGALDLLKEQASAFEALGQAGIAAVTQSAEQAKATQIAAIERVRDAQLAAHAVALQAIEAQLQAAQQWLSAVQGAESFVQSLLLGAGSPLNPAEQLAMVKAQYEAARGAATSSPEALSAAIQAAQTYLSVLGRGQEPGKESAAFKSATADVLKDVRGFLSQTGSSGAIKGQITLLQQQLESMKAVGQAISDAAAKQIEAAKKEIDAAAKAIITGIVTDLTTALDENTTRQNELISSIFDSQLESMKAITGGRPAQEFLALKTKEMADTLLAIAYSLQRIQLGAGPANPSAPIRPEAPDRPPDTPMPTEGTRRALPMGAPFVPTRGATSAPRSGDVHVTIGSGAVVVSVAGGDDPRRAAREIVDEINKMVRAGAVGLIDGKAVAKR